MDYKLTFTNVKKTYTEETIDCRLCGKKGETVTSKVRDLEKAIINDVLAIAIRINMGSQGVLFRLFDLERLVCELTDKQNYIRLTETDQDSLKGGYYKIAELVKAGKMSVPDNWFKHGQNFIKQILEPVEFKEELKK